MIGNEGEGVRGGLPWVKSWKMSLSVWLIEAVSKVVILVIVKNIIRSLFCNVIQLSCSY